MRRWARLSQVDRVELYTRQSLYLLLWGASAGVVLGGTEDGRGHPVEYAVAAGGALLVTLAATPVLREISTLYPASRPLPWPVLAPYLVLAGAYVGVGLGLPDAARAVTVMVTFSTLALSLGGLRSPGATAGLLVVLAALPAVSSGRARWALGGLVVAAFFLVMVRISLWLLTVVTELDRARGAQAALAVAEERLRFSRDVHDVLGRRLSTIAVQSELAATLAARGGDEGTAARMMEVRGVAHDALREARELARGYRSTDLAQELEGARSLLRSAGIAVSLDVDGLPPRWHEPAAWVIREAVTNVLRHSKASRVAIRYADRQLSITNDGPTGPEGGPAGTGLAGLRERLEPLGADVATRSDAAEFVLTATLPPTSSEVLA